jgi:hypothetical protein
MDGGKRRKRGLEDEEAFASEQLSGPDKQVDQST